jgi:hypothetical protein
MIIRLGRLRTTRTDSDSTTSTMRGSFSTCAASAIASADGVTEARSTVRASAFETIFCAITTTSPSRNARLAVSAAFAIRDARSSPARTIGKPGIAKMSRRVVIPPRHGTARPGHRAVHRVYSDGPVEPGHDGY